jgi:molybdate transport system substrate-binding protein
MMMKTKMWFPIGLILAILLSACGASAPTRSPAATATPTVTASEAVTVNVFAAASLTEAFSEIGKQVEAQHGGVTVVFNFAGSQQLAQQLAEGAPADVFASANQKQMDAVIKSEQVVSGTSQTFLSNRLVLIYPKDNPAKLTQLQDLAKPGLKLVLAAKEVPVGQYALDFLDKTAKDQTFGASFKDNVLKNVVSYENDVKAVLTKVVLGEADAGIVYSSDVVGDNAAKVGQIEIPDALNVIAKYPIAVIKDSTHPDLARSFVDYVLSPAGQAILAKFGFIPVKK